MKKWMFVTIIVSLVLALTACGSTQNAKASATASTTLSLEGQLLVGTFKLENTSLAVSSEQAGTLLPLWETLQSLASSNTAASQEVDAVVSQIESSMSTQQVSSITAMKLTQQDLAATAIDTGTASTTASFGQYCQNQRSPVPGRRWGSRRREIHPATWAAGWAAQRMSRSASQTQTGTSQAVSTQSAVTTNQVPAAMIKALVALLQKKMG